jgi:probable HAF family extracellular repeat protein
MCTQTVVGFCLAAALSLVVTAAHAVTQYVVTDLGTLGGSWSEAYGINDVGQVVGQSRTTSAYSDAFLWEDGLMQDLSAPPDNRANDINNHGRIVGWGVGSGQRHSIYWEYGEEYGLGISLGRNEAHDVNECDQIVGFTYTDSGSYHAYLWEDWAWQDLGTLGGPESRAFGINDSTQIVGVADTSGGAARAFLWYEGIMQDLGTFGGRDSLAYDVSNTGQVVGRACLPSGLFHAFLWHGGTMQDLGTFGGSQSEAFALNDRGQIVGAADTGDDYPHAFLWESGVMHNLNDLIPQGSGWVLNKAYDINELGQIVGYGVNPDGHTRGFLLTPIPEPSALALLLVAVVAMMLRKQR